MSHDAVVVGSGPNGLVAANHLLDKGWSVLVLEAQPDIGGAVRSAEDVAPGFVHDTFSSFYPLAAASPTIRSLDLERHGLRWRHAPAVLGHPRADGSWALLHRDREVTARLLEEARPGDGEAWAQLCGQWDRIGEHLVTGLVTPFPPVRSGLAVLAKLRSVGGLEFVKTLLTPAADLGPSLFEGPHAALLLAGNAGHADIPLDSPGSGLMALLMTMLGQTVGFPVPEGGAGQLSGALARRIESLGGEIRTSCAVTSIDVTDGVATGVRTEHGDRVEALRAVVADVAAPILYGRLLDPDDVPDRTARGMRRFQLDPSTVKVDWALSGPVPWASTPAYAPGTIHVGDSVEQMTEAFGQIAANAVPAKPFLLVGQMSTADPSRSPIGTESAWAYTHLPRGVADDASADQLSAAVDVVLDKYAPGFSEKVIGKTIQRPSDLEASDANLHSGAVNGGTSQLYQQLIFRPAPGFGRAETSVENVYLGSAGATPGGGVHGVCGRNAAKAALANDGARGWPRRRLTRTMITLTTR